MVYKLTLAIVARMSTLQQGGNVLSCTACSVEDEHHFLFDCLAYSRIRHEHSSPFQNASPHCGSCPIDQPGLLGYYLKTFFTHTQSVLTKFSHHPAVFPQDVGSEALR